MISPAKDGAGQLGLCICLKWRQNKKQRQAALANVRAHSTQMTLAILVTNVI